MNEKEDLSASTCNFNIESFVLKQLKLLENEKEAEVEENKTLRESSSLKTLQKKGLCIPKLHVSNLTTGLFGRLMLSFQAYFNNPLPAHSISSGDIVGVGKVNSDGKIEVITSGVVFRVSDSTLTVAFEKNSDASDLENDDHLVVIKLANDVTFKRLKRALKNLENKSRDSHLVSVLFGAKQPSSLENSNLNDVVFYNDKLNLAQKEAVKFSLSQKELSILHGPPGTGKTTTLVECILQAASQKLKILACAPSNVAVDNLVEKLAFYKIKMVRLGHPARVHSNIQQYSLDFIVSQYDGSDVVADLRQELDKLTKKADRRCKDSGSRRYLWNENKTLLKEIKEREKDIVKQVMKNVDIVLSTLTSASDDGPLKHVEKDHFDICFIDECSQALEAACWIPLMLVKRCVLAGDHNQLPPTIISKNAAKEGLSVTLMERLLKLHGDSIKKMLTVQYRMHQHIMTWSSKQFYDNNLIADDSVCTHLLKDLPNVMCNENTEIPLLLIDTAGCDLYELETADEDSKGNEGEADIVAYHAKLLINSGVPCSEIAIITPYNLQVDLLKSRLSKTYPKLEIKSVDGFQGREKEAVLLSLVRSNIDGEVGFLAEDRRINVAITRAKRHLTVVCDTRTVSHHDFLKSFIKYCEEKGEVRSAFEYEKEIGQYSMLVKKKEVKDKSKVYKKKIPEKQEFYFQIKEDLEKFKKDKEIERLAAEIKSKQMIDEFIASKKESFLFPTSLSAFERKIVHELSESLGLIHISSGEGTERCIQIKKCSTESSTSYSEVNRNPTDTIKPLEAVPKVVLDEIENQLEHNDQNISVVKSSNDSESKTSLSKGYVEGTEKNKHLKVPEKSKIKKESESKKSKPKLKTLKINDASEENFDDIIQQVMKADNTCCYGNCKKSVAILSQTCQFCNCRFCFSHFIPEAHGCGDAAKAQARSQIRKDGVLYPGSGRPEKKIDPIKQSYLQKKLDKKLNDLSQQRKTKPKK